MAVNAFKCSEKEHAERFESIQKVYLTVTNDRLLVGVGNSEGNGSDCDGEVHVKIVLLFQLYVYLYRGQ